MTVSEEKASAKKSYWPYHQQWGLLNLAHNGGTLTIIRRGQYRGKFFHILFSLCISIRIKF